MSVFLKDVMVFFSVVSGTFLFELVWERDAMFNMDGMLERIGVLISRAWYDVDLVNWGWNILGLTAYFLRHGNLWPILDLEK